MSWWNLGGMNGNFKEFTDRHPDKTMLGMIWALQWRMMVFILALELVFAILFALVSFIGK